MIEDRYQNTPAGPAWPIMQRRWQSLVNHALLLVRKADQGVPYNRYELHAAKEIVKLHEEQRWQDVMFRAASVFILQDFEPWAFKSDKAVRFQLQRLVRSLGPTHTAEYIKNGGGTGKQYPYYPPKTAEILGQWLADTFGVLGLRIVQLERHKGRDRQEGPRGLPVRFGDATMTGTIFYNMIEEDPVEITALMSEVLHPRTGEEVSVVECLGITMRDPFNAIPALCRTLVASGIQPWTTIEFVRVNKDDGTEVQCFKPRPVEEWAWRQLSERQGRHQGQEVV